MVEEELRLWAPILIAVAAFVWNIGIYRASVRKDELAKVHERVDEVKRDLARHQEEGSASRTAIAERLTHIEGTLQHMPDAASSQRMEVAITQLQGQLAVLAERLGPVVATSERLQEFLLERSNLK